MWIVRLALRRPYTFVVAALVLLLLTPFVLLRTPTDVFPEIDIPVISVVWVYNGLNAKEVEERIVYNHERMISTLVNDIEHIESTAYNGAGVIKVFLQPGASVTEGVAQITASGQTVLRFLPPGINPPFIIRYNASSVPILQYSLASSKFSEQELQDMAMNRIRVGLATVRGASVPGPAGGKARVVAVDIDLPALESKNLAPQDVVGAFNAQNFMLPSGTAKIGETEYSIALNTNAEVISALNDLPIKTVGGAVIRIGDVAHVHDGYQPQQNIVRLNGVRGVLLTILKSGAASTLSVVDGVKKAMPRILSGLPPELEASEFADQSLFVRAAVNDVVKEGVIAAALTAMMILLFLGSWKSTFIIALSIPLSILTSLAALSALGETINLMTLGGLALAVGILVDDATVEIENIHRQMAMGKSNIQAILDGAQEIAMPAFVSTLCICIVFVPMFFLTGVARHLFVPLAEAVVFAMLASYALSRTLVPTLVMWFYRNIEGGHPVDTGKSSFWLRPFARLQRVFEHGFDRFREGYRRLLGAVLSHRILFAMLFLAFCAGTGALIPQLGQNFFPTVDAGQFRLHVRAPGGTRIEETTRLVDRIEAVIREVVPARELAGVLDNIGIPSGGIPLTYLDNGVTGTGDADILVSLNRDHRPTDDYVRQLRTRLGREFAGSTFYFLPADIVNQTINFGLPAPIDIQIMGRDREKSREIAAKLADNIRKVPGAVAGVIWSLYLTLTTLSVPALMGAIMSLGVATANSVLVISFARTHLAQGNDPLTSAWEAGVGRLRPVLMTADSRTLPVEMETDNAKGEILSGSYAKVRFIDVKMKASLTLPANTVFFRPEGPRIGVVNADGKVSLRSISIGRDFGQSIEIITGVGPKDRIIVNPSDSLVDGTMVTASEAVPAEKKP